MTPPVPPKPHHQQLEQRRRVPVACGIEEQHTHLRTTAGRKGKLPVPPGDLQHHHHHHTARCAPLCILSLLMGLVLAEGGLAEPAHAGLDAAGGVSSIQVPGHGAVGQHLGPAQPLCVPQAWGSTGHGWDPHATPSTGTPWGSSEGQTVPSSMGSSMALLHPVTR